MDSKTIILVLILVAGVALVMGLMTQKTGPSPSKIAATHQVTHWKVQVGAEAMSGSLQAMRFMPGEITIHAGDSVTWDMGNVKAEHHTIFFAAGSEPPPLILEGADKRAYFEPMYLIPEDGSHFDGSMPLSGGELSPDVKTYMATFTKSGDYPYFCAFHPGMEGVVHVLGPDQPLPKSAADYAAISQKESGVALEKANQLSQQASHPLVTQREDGTKEFVIDLMGDQLSMATLLAFVPTELHLRVGDTVTWKMSDMAEIHTVTFFDDPKNMPELVFVEEQSDGPPLFVVNPEVMGPMGGSEIGDMSYHNSGFLIPMAGAESPTYSLTFIEPGTYQYWCVIHPDMKGKIVVEPGMDQILAESIDRFEAAVKMMDSAAVGAFYADDAELLPPSETKVEGRADITDFWQGYMEAFQSLELDLTTLEMYDRGDLVIEVGSYKFVIGGEPGTEPVTDTGKYVTIWQRQSDGSWKIKIDTWNSDLPAAPE